MCIMKSWNFTYSKEKVIEFSIIHGLAVFHPAPPHAHNLILCQGDGMDCGTNRDDCSVRQVPHSFPHHRLSTSYALPQHHSSHRAGCRQTTKHAQGSDFWDQCWKLSSRLPWYTDIHGMFHLDHGMCCT